MKKVLTIALIIGFVFAGNALADEYIDGFCTFDYMEIYESKPCTLGEGCEVRDPDWPGRIWYPEAVSPCYAEFLFETPNGQFFDLTGIAYGTALNLAILKAGNFGETVSCNLKYRFVPGFDIRIRWVDYEFPFDIFNGPSPGNG